MDEALSMKLAYTTIMFDNVRLREKISDYERRIRQLEDEQTDYTETALAERARNAEAKLEAYEKRFEELRKLFDREIQ